MNDKNKNDKKYYAEKIAQLEHEISDLNEEMRVKEKAHRRKEKDLEGSVNKYKNEGKSCKEMIEEMQRDYNRLA